MTLFVTTDDHDRVVLVHVHFPSGKMTEDLEELNELALSAGAVITSVITATRRGA